jgi:hypothetical protein
MCLHFIETNDKKHTLTIGKRNGIEEEAEQNGIANNKCQRNRHWF